MASRIAIAHHLRHGEPTPALSGYTSSAPLPVSAVPNRRYSGGAAFVMVMEAAEMGKRYDAATEAWTMDGTR